MKVRIDQKLCTGDGLCEDTCPALFELHEDDALAHVRTAGHIVIDGSIIVPPELEEFAEIAAEECPGECIIIE